MNSNSKEKPYIELFLFWFGVITTIIALIVVISSYVEIQHNKWIAEEKAKHAWDTDFEFVGITDVSCDYDASNGGYRYTIKGAIKNISGYNVNVNGIYFRFYDTNGNLICALNTGYIGYLSNGETKEYTKLTAEYYSAIPSSCVCFGVDYSLEIK